MAKLLGQRPPSRTGSVRSDPQAPTAKAKAKPKPQAKAASVSAASQTAGTEHPVPDSDGDDSASNHEDNADEFHDPEPEDVDTTLLRDLNKKGLKAHMDKFPLGDNLMGLMLVAMADLNEAQRLSFTSATVTRSLKIPKYTFEGITEIFIELFCANKTAFNNPFLNSRSGGGGRSFCILEEGEYGEETGYWAIDEETQEEGFLPEFGDTFWIYDGEAFFGKRLTHGRNLKKLGKGGKGKFRSRFKRRPGFKGRRKPGKGKSYEANDAEDEDEEEEEDEETSLNVKARKNKPFRKGNHSAKGNPSSDSQQDPKGKGKKGQGKPWKGKGKANVAEDNNS